jgi:hypothetical protein
MTEVLDKKKDKPINSRFVLFRTVSGNWFEPLGQFIESLLYVNSFKLV